MSKTDKIFSPKSIAIIGASRDKKKLGYQILSNLIKSKYRGRIYPINPKAKTINGVRAYASVLDVSSRIDLAVFVVPAEIVPNLMKEVGKKKIPAAIVISAGFAETGKEGQKKEQELLSICQKYKTKVVGPNCLGVIDAYTPLNVSFAKTRPIKHNLSVVSQSGAMCTAILDWANKNNIGFSKFVSLGNKIDIDESDMFLSFLNDKNTKVVLGYFEGIKDGKKFIRNAKKLTSKKPLIAIKAGQSEAGAKAASSHTGALTSDRHSVDAAFKKAEIIKVDNIQDLFDFSEAFSVLPYPRDEKVAVLTNAGGPGVLTTDFISRYPLKLAELSSKTKKNLKNNLPEESSVNNPVDVVGDAPASRFKKAGEIILSDENVASLIVLLTPQTATEVEKTAKVIVGLKNKFQKPIVTSFIGGPLVESGVKILERNKVPNFEYPERAVRALSMLATSRKNIAVPKILEKNVKRNKQVEQIIKKAQKEKRANLNDRETKKIMNAIGIDTAKSKLVKNSTQAKKAAKTLGYPVVLKIVSCDVLHKTEYGLVKTGINSEKEAAQAYLEIIKNAKKLKIDYEGVMVYEMVKEGIELIIGAKKDKSFGPVLMFGLGGTLVEILKDTSHAIAPISFSEASDMIFSIKGHELLTGYRGKKGIKINDLRKDLLKISDLVWAFPEIAELDINPLKADEKKTTALDIKLVLEA